MFSHFQRINQNLFTNNFKCLLWIICNNCVSLIHREFARKGAKIFFSHKAREQLNAIDISTEKYTLISLIINHKT